MAHHNTVFAQILKFIPTCLRSQKWPPIIGQCAKRLRGLCRLNVGGVIVHFIRGLDVQGLISAMLVVKPKIIGQ